MNARTSAKRISMLATLVDALYEFRRGRRRSGALLVAAAALSSRVPGLGTAASVAMRLVRRLR